MSADTSAILLAAGQGSRIEGTTVDAHLAAIERYRDAVADLL